MSELTAMATIAPVLESPPLPDDGVCDPGPVPFELSAFCRLCNEPSSSPNRAVLDKIIGIMIVRGGDSFNGGRNEKCGTERISRVQLNEEVDRLCTGATESP
jgi:hypothetical protein